MIVHYSDKKLPLQIQADGFAVPFARDISFFVCHEDAEREVPMTCDGSIHRGNLENLWFSLECLEKADHLQIRISVENRGDRVFSGRIGLHMGIDSYMATYPQWHEPFFPTLLRCEKTHLWGYYMNTAENALAVVTAGPVASYDIRYNMLDDGDFGHRILGTDILLFHNGPQPQRHPDHLASLEAGGVYENSLFLIPVKSKLDILPTLARVGKIPVVAAEKFTLELGERLQYRVLGEDIQVSLILPNGAVTETMPDQLTALGRYTLQVRAAGGKQCQAAFFCRPGWDFYLQNAARQALAKPQKPTTHVESFYGLFSCYLAAKRYRDPVLLQQARESFDRVIPLMFDMQTHTPEVIPERIQNTALLLSLLADMYEADGDVQWLRHGAAFADWLMTKQTADGVYRKDGRIHYTCVIYIAKGMLELALAEKDCAGMEECYLRHYQSAKRAVDELAESLDHIDTEGESTLEDGMIACSALQIGMFALTLPVEQRQPYIRAAEKMLSIHSCLEQQLIPDCRVNGASLRYWESQYDVMVMANMLNSPHGWSAWTAYAHYYCYLLTGKKQHLLSLMNGLGSGIQLMDLNGNLRWAYCAQPYVKAKTLVPDHSRPVGDGGFRGKYEEKEYGECYIPMISGWYRIAEQQPVGGYAWCPLFLKDATLEVDNQGGCCDNDVHEIFKCMEETVLGKAFVHENEDGSFLTYGCTVQKDGCLLQILPAEGTQQVICCVRTEGLQPEVPVDVRCAQI